MCSDKCCAIGLQRFPGVASVRAPLHHDFVFRVIAQAGSPFRKGQQRSTPGRDQRRNPISRIPILTSNEDIDDLWRAGRSSGGQDVDARDKNVQSRYDQACDCEEAIVLADGFY